MNESSKASFKRHKIRHQDFTNLDQSQWDHWNLPFQTARETLDGILDLTVLSPWTYRNAISYSLRSQKDFDDPFKLAKFAGGHSDWKPFLAHILGFDGKVVENGYALEAELSKLEGEEHHLLARASGVTDIDQLRGQLEIVGQEVASAQQELENFDFSPEDKRTTRALVSNLDSRIVHLNELRYSLNSDRAKIQSALDVHLSINLKALQKIFKESQLYFGEQVKKDFAALEQFNKELAEERDEYLKKDLEEIESQLGEIDSELVTLNEERSTALASLSDPESLSKYKRLTKQLVNRQADYEMLSRLQGVLDDLTNKRTQIKEKKQQLEAVGTILQKAVASPSNRYKAIRTNFNQIVTKVIDQHANLFTRVNKEDHLEFRVDILDSAGNPSAAGDGFSYGRLLCIAFDLAIIKAYIKEPFPHFVYHDGFLETLDDRKKLNLIEVVREHCKLGTQQIVTVIDSELPRLANGRKFAFTADETILTLTDEGDNGRLFKMPSW
ncbi:MAG: DUF2326 domain-containing protein [Planctomycetaceae bacterium]